MAVSLDSDVTGACCLALQLLHPASASFVGRLVVVSQHSLPAACDVTRYPDVTTEHLPFISQCMHETEQKKIVWKDVRGGVVQSDGPIDCVAPDISSPTW
jgi:hypothetical protein